MSSSKLGVFIVGATGEVGKALVKELAKNEQISKVTLIGRRAVDLPTDDPNYQKFNQKAVDFEKLNEYSEAFEGHDTGFCVLGTTRAKAGAEGFYRVDHDYVLESAKLAKQGGCKHFNLLSSGGANKNSFFLYTKTKGQVEEDVKALDFERLTIYQPGLFIVNRVESRLAESCLQVFAGLDFGHHVSIKVPLLAAAMVKNCFTPAKEKVEVLLNKELYNIATQNST